MVTIAHLVSKYLEDKPFIQEALAKGIIHFGGLAEQIKPWLEKELGKKVKLPAVIMALRRYAEKLKKEFIAAFPKKKLKEIELAIKSNVIDFAIVKSSTIFNVLKKLYGLVDFERGDTLQVVQGTYEVTLITNQKYKERFLKELKNEKVKHVEENMSAFSIKFPIDFLYVPGFIFVIIRALSWHNINIFDMVSTLTELTFILNEKDAVKAFDALQMLKK